MYRKNLFLNPNFNPNGMHMGAWGQNNSSFMPGDGTFIPDKSTYTLLLPELVIGAEYVFMVECLSKSGGCSVWAATNVQLSSFTQPSGGVVKIDFTYETDNNVQSVNRILWDAGIYKNPTLELKETYDAAFASGGPEFFAWDTMPISIN